MPLGTPRVAATRLNVTANSTAWAVPYETTVALGELMLVVFGGTANATAPTATGWTLVGSASDTTATGGSAHVMRKVALAADVTASAASGSVTFTMPNTQGTAVMVVQPGADETTPIDVAASTYATGGTASASYVMPSVTTVTADARIFYWWSGANGATTATGPAGSTEIFDWGGLSLERPGAAYRDTTDQAAAGATGTRTVTLSTARKGGGVLFAVRPSATTTITGTGAATTAATTGSGSGTMALSGTGAGTTAATTGSGSGTMALSGTGAATAAAVTHSGAAYVAITGTGAGTTAAVTHWLSSRNLFSPALIQTSFEDSTTTGWAGRTNVASLASVAGSAAHGSRSMLVTATAAGGTVGVITSGFHPCSPSLNYAFGFNAVTSLSFQLFVDWYNAAGVYLSSLGVGLGAPAGGSGRLTAVLTAPASAAQFKVFIEALSTPANGTYNVDSFQYEQASAATAYTPGAGSGVVSLTGTGVATAAPVTGAGSGTVGSSAVTGTGAATAAPVTHSGSGTLALSGTGAATVAPATGTGSGTLRLTGTGAGATAASTATGSGTVGTIATGTGAATTAAATATGSGTLRLTGTGAGTTAAATGTGAGSLRLSGTGAATTATATAAGSGTVRVTGTSATTTAAALAAGYGMVGGVDFVDVTWALFDPEETPLPRQHVRARLVTPGFLLNDTEVTAPYETYSTVGGQVTLSLIPSAYFTTPAVYLVTWKGGKYRIAVPESGPVTLASVLVP